VSAFSLFAVGCSAFLSHPAELSTQLLIVYYFPYRFQRQPLLQATCMLPSLGAPANWIKMINSFPSLTRPLFSGFFLTHRLLDVPKSKALNAFLNWSFSNLNQRVI
jgi:hypothetical protein